MRVTALPCGASGICDLDEHTPENQGFDYAHYIFYNAAFWMWSDVEKHYQADDVVGMPTLTTFREMSSMKNDTASRFTGS